MNDDDVIGQEYKQLMNEVANSVFETNHVASFLKEFIL